MPSSQARAIEAHIGAHLEPLCVALWSNQASGRAQACPQTMCACCGRWLKLLRWLDSRPQAVTLPVAMESQNAGPLAQLDVSEAAPLTCVVSGVTGGRLACLVLSSERPGSRVPPVPPRRPPRPRPRPRARARVTSSASVLSFYNSYWHHWHVTHLYCTRYRTRG